MTTQILIVDDEQAVRDMFALYLTGVGYRVETCGEGSEALEICARCTPALVMCDLRMPGRMDGLELLAKLKAAHETLPVIVVSGTGEMEDAIQALKLGAADFLTKPIPDLEVLKHAVDRTLERSRLIEENRLYRANLEEINERLELSLAQQREDEAAGRRVQFALMPRESQRFGDYECSHHIQSSSLLSGDFIDYFTVDRDRFAFYMIDVSGHGISSAVITVIVKSLISRYLEDFRRYRDATILDPAALLTALNRHLLEGQHDKYLTIFYAIVDSRKASMTYAIGGQFPYPYCYDGDSVQQMGEKSPPVGLFADAAYSSVKHRIGDRFALRVYSDGVLDFMPDLSLKEAKGYLGEISARLDLDAGDIARLVGLPGWESPLDDASILSVRRVAADA